LKTVSVDPVDSVGEKVAAIFAELAGDRARQLSRSSIATPIREAIASALSSDYGAATAEKIALHMSDWNSDAAFIVALHLFPERFTSEEIDAGIGLFLIHAPNHIREACRLTDTYVWADFPDDDEHA
jgi:hypothetical protein